MKKDKLKHLVLVGGGHSHVIALHHLHQKKKTFAHWQITLISDQLFAPYSGMFPGYLAGYYDFHQIHFDLAHLCRKMGVHFIEASVEGLDPIQKQIYLKGGKRIDFDLVSINVGSEPRPVQELENGNREISEKALKRVIPMKPIYQFVHFWKDWLKEVSEAQKKSITLAIVGGGASGIEVALVLKHRLAAQIKKIYLLQKGKALVPNYNLQVQQVLAEKLKEAGVEVHLNTHVKEVNDQYLIDENGLRFVADHIFWATHASTKKWFSSSHLPVDDQGFLIVEESLQVKGFPHLFAAGDCIHFTPRELPKSGVFAVREGPILAKNLIRVMNHFGFSTQLVPYVPQKRSLALISLGKKEAVAAYGRWSFQGQWVWRWKDHIDQGFMKKYQLRSKNDHDDQESPLTAK